MTAPERIWLHKNSDEMHSVPPSEWASPEYAIEYTRSDLAAALLARAEAAEARVAVLEGALSRLHGLVNELSWDKKTRAIGQRISGCLAPAVLP